MLKFLRFTTTPIAWLSVIAYLFVIIPWKDGKAIAYSYANGLLIAEKEEEDEHSQV
jgi:hypothetical protein